MEDFEEYLRKHKAGTGGEKPPERIKDNLLRALAGRRVIRMQIYYGIVAACMLLAIVTGLFYRRTTTPVPFSDSIKKQISGVGRRADSSGILRVAAILPKRKVPSISRRSAHAPAYKRVQKRPGDGKDITLNYKEKIFRQRDLIKITGVRFLSREDCQQFENRYRENLKQVDDEKKIILNSRQAVLGGGEASKLLAGLYRDELHLLHEMYERMNFINNQMILVGNEGIGKIYYVTI